MGRVVSTPTRSDISGTLKRLRTARGRLAMPGVWVGYQPGRGEECALSALGLSEYSHEAALALKDALRQRGDDAAVHRYNDAPGRTLDDILSLYDDAIAELEASE